MSYERRNGLAWVRGDYEALGAAPSESAQYISTVASLAGAVMQSPDAGKLSIAGQASAITLASAVGGGIDVAKFAEGAQAALGAANSVFQAVASSNEIAQSLAGLVGGLCDSIPIINVAAKVVLGVVGAITSAYEGEIAAEKEAADLRVRERASYCSQVAWAPKPREKGRIYPSDLFNLAPVDIYGNMPKMPVVPGHTRAVMPMPVIGRILIQLLETPKFKKQPSWETNDDNPWLGVASEAKRKWFKKAREAMQHAPPGSDGGMLLWPMYMDLAYDEILNRGASLDNGTVVWNKTPKETGLPDGLPYYPKTRGEAWKHMLSMMNADSCDDEYSFDALMSLMLSWGNDYVLPPKFAQGSADRKKMLAEVQRLSGEYARIKLGMRTSKDLFAAATVAIKASTKGVSQQYKLPPSPYDVKPVIRDVAPVKTTTGGGTALAVGLCATAAALGGLLYWRKHPELKAKIRSKLGRRS